MKDLYRRLGLDETAGDAAVRAALAAAGDDATREAAEYILLDPQRREVYDRNRRVLLTIGRLRANLGLNLTRFWPRPRFADFTVDLAPTSPRPADDPMRIAWAFGVVGRRGAVPAQDRRRTGAALLAIIILLSAVAWWTLRPH
jgi:hypothetical protein